MDAKTKEIKKLPIFLFIVLNKSFTGIILNYNKLDGVSINAFSKDPVVKAITQLEEGKSFDSWLIKYLLKSWKDVIDLSKMTHKGVLMRDFHGKERTPLKLKISKPKDPEGNVAPTVFGASKPAPNVSRASKPASNFISTSLKNGSTDQMYGRSTDS